MTEPTPSWLDRALGFLSPQLGLRRMRARLAAELLARYYEGGGNSRRTQGWRRTATDANAAAGPYIRRLRETARDLVRNNPYAESALATIADHVVGWGVTAKAPGADRRLMDAWERWSGTTACDADGINDLAGLQKLVMRTMAESGEALVLRRWRTGDERLPLPVQLQVIEPDYLDTLKDLVVSDSTRIIQGVEFDGNGRRVAYWLFSEHPGSNMVTRPGAIVSRRVPASEVLHVFRPSRPGQVRGVTWFAPDLLRFKDFDEYEDATLMKQKVAACLAVIVSDPDGSASPLGTPDDTKTPPNDLLEPGMIMNAPPGRSVEVVQPPSVRDYADYSRTTLRAIATGLGVTYEDLTGDYAGMPYSAARMSRLRHQARVDDWRWRLLIPRFCNPAWNWAMQAAQILGLVDDTIPKADWTAPPAPMIDPVNEGKAYQQNVRTGLMTLSEAIRERGYDPVAVLEEMAADNERLDKLGLVLDSDPRKVSAAGLTQARPPGTVFPDPSKTDTGGEDGGGDGGDDGGGGGGVPAGEDDRAAGATELFPGLVAQGLELSRDPRMTPKQAEALATIRRYHLSLGEPCPASYVAEELGVSRQRVGEYYRSLYNLGLVLSPGSPAVPVRATPVARRPLSNQQLPRTRPGAQR